ncbi:hypothetical protein K9M50_02140 [Patescibacteria group bacterium]|nr:hypothetical protein [Patescibacteria group bacterium]
MPNKIAGFTLNNSPKNINSEFYIAQPDGVKESLGGKIFMLIQSDAKKSDLIELADFLVSALDKYYYNDEKILLREKLDNLKVENIFEAMLSKLNLELSNFLKNNKNKVDLNTLSLSIGVAYNNEIYFSQLGNNKAFVIYKKEDNYETLKLTADDEDENSENNTKVQLDKFFSNVISGEIPAGSFFVISNETLSEYISSETFKDIITNLPPLGAAEQIKNKLKEINARVPFSGIIIKNTYGQTESDAYIKSEMEASLNLKQTEEKTAKILSTAGLVNKDKLKEHYKKVKKFLKPKIKAKNVHLAKNNDRSIEENKNIEEKGNKDKFKANKQKILLKDKIIMKKKPGIIAFIKKIPLLLPSLNKNSFPTVKKANKSSKILNFKRREKMIISGIAVLIVVLVTSILISNHQKKLEEERLAYQEEINNIEKNQNQIESYLLYGNEKSALELLKKTENSINNLPKEKEERLKNFQEFKKVLEKQYQDLRHVVEMDAEKLLDLPNNEVASNISLVDNNLYLPAKNVDNLYQINTDSNNINTIEFGYDSENLKYPALDNFNNLYYSYDNNKVLQILLPEQEVNTFDLEISNENAEITALEGYGTRFYVLDNNNSQVYRYNNNTSNLSFDTNWVNNPSELNNPVDIEIDVSIYFLEKDGDILKFSSGEKESFSTDIVDPKINDASKLFFTDNFVYIIENDMNRVIQYQFTDSSNEALNFKNQYYFNNIDNISDIIVNNNDLAYILQGSEVYTVDLSSLE